MNQKTTHISLLLFLVLIFTQQLDAQKARFSGYYPLCTPDDSPAELEPELEMTLMAIAGGCKVADDPKTPKKREDPEAYIHDDYKESLLKMVAYATEIAGKLDNSNVKTLTKKLEKSIKKKKFNEALNALMQAKINTQEDIIMIYFLWSDYLYEKEQDAPWLKPIARKTSRSYRGLINSAVEYSKERPFGAQAQLGGVVADAAQALSNCMENPEELAWQGEGKIRLQQADELRRLASDVAYLEWRMHDAVNGRRAYMINREVVFKVKKALFDLAAAMSREQKDWHNDPHHGENLQVLYDTTFDNEWRVDGTNALKGTKGEEKGIEEIDRELPSRRAH
jgi:hypothetical protein